MLAFVCGLNFSRAVFFTAVKNVLMSIVGLYGALMVCCVVKPTIADFLVSSDLKFLQTLKQLITPPSQFLLHVFFLWWRRNVLR